MAHRIGRGLIRLITAHAIQIQGNNVGNMLAQHYTAASRGIMAFITCWQVQMWQQRVVSMLPKRATSGKFEDWTFERREDHDLTGLQDEQATALVSQPAAHGNEFEVLKRPSFDHLLVTQKCDPRLALGKHQGSPRP